MSKFDSNATKKSESNKNFNDLAEDFVPFWEPVFASLKLSTIEFKTKLCYSSNEFPLDENGEKPNAIRFFKSELSLNKDIYIELCNWEHSYFDPMVRRLYKLKNNPNWEKEPEKYKLSSNRKHPSYAILVSDLELVNETSVTKGYAEISKEHEAKPSALPRPEEDEEYADIYEDLKDEGISKMTIRDFYCIIQNKPHSRKEWLNKLIKS